MLLALFKGEKCLPFYARNTLRALAAASRFALIKILRYKSVLTPSTFVKKKGVP